MTESSERPMYTPTTHRISKAKKGRRVHGCTYADCGKVFTRAEHLRRHQLNHRPEALYKCDIAGCPKTFQRPDLRARHMERHEQQNQKAIETIFQHGSRYSKPIASTGADSAHSVPFSGTQAEYLPSARTSSSQGPSILAPGHTGGPSTPSPPVTSAYPITHILSLHIPQQIPDLYNSTSIASSPYSSASSQSTLSPYPGAPCPQEPYGVTPRGSVSSTQAIDPALFPPIRTPVSAHPGYETWTIAQSPQVLSSPQCESYYQPVGFSTFRPLSQERTQNLPASAVPFSHLDERTWHQLRSMAVESAGAVHPGLEGSLVNIEKANSYLQNYWQRFDTSLPIVHRSTFSASSNIPLTAVMVAIGAQYEDDWQAKAFASLLHQGFMRAVANKDITSASSNSDIQGVILSEMFCRLRFKKIDVQASPVFRQLSSSLLEAQHGQSTEQDAISAAAQQLSITSEVSEWKRWIDLETRRRLVLSVFMWDIQQATFFKQSPCNPPENWTAVGLCLPCSKQAWTCDSPDEWNASQNLIPQGAVPLGDIVRSFTSLDQQPQHLDEFASALALSGLMSVAIIIDREEAGRSIAAAVAKKKREGLENSYQSWWHFYFSSYEGPSSTATTPTSKDSRTLVTYHMALLTLCVDIRSLLTVAGESFMFGQKRQEADYLQAKSDLRIWAESPSTAAKATWHAAHILRLALHAEKTAMTLSTHWCMYIAALVCWASGYAHSARPQSPSTGEAATTSWPYLEAMNTQSWEGLNAVKMRHKTTGLLVHVRAELQKSTCGESQLLSEGAQVLRRLAEGRSTFCRF
ncbi:MAG: hypothetical protein M1840_004358 [Geoglossum simile]|nr:MAG: hypothetical protein M1840_004358 [Geoglossum simile]